MNAGSYVATVIEHRLNWSSNGTFGVKVLFQLDATDNETIWGDIWITENTRHMARKSLHAIGFDPETQSLELLHDSKTFLLGRKCRLEIAEDIYKGVARLKIQFINSLDERPKDADAQVKRADLLLREAKKTQSGPPTSPASRVKPPESSPKEPGVSAPNQVDDPDGEDIPF